MRLKFTQNIEVFKADIISHLSSLDVFTNNVNQLYVNAIKKKFFVTKWGGVDALKSHFLNFINKQSLQTNTVIDVN